MRRGKREIYSIDIIVKYIQSQPERPAGVSVLDSPLLYPSIPPESLS